MRTKPWAYMTMAMSLINMWFGLVCLGVISWFSILKPEKVMILLFEHERFQNHFRQSAIDVLSATKMIV